MARNGHNRRPRPATVEVPTAHDSARAILAAVLVHPKLYGVWREHVRPGEFFAAEDQLLARAMENCHSAGQDPDRVLLDMVVRDQLARGIGPQRLYDDPGALEHWLDQLGVDAVIFDHEYLIRHAKRVHAAYVRRKRGQALQELARAALQDEDHTEHLERVARFVEDERKVAPADDISAAALVRTEWARALPPAIATGLAPLDKAIGGLRAEGVYFLCGGTGQGKTGLAIQLSGHIAHGYPLVYVTSELSRRQVIARFAAQRYNCPWLQLYSLAPEGMAELAGAVGRFFPKLYILKLARETSITVELARLMDRLGVPPVLVLDYIQHAARRLNPDDRRIATSALSDDIARYTTDTRGAALVLSSVARGFYKGNEDKAAVDFLGAAKESGDLEFDASGVLFLDTELEAPDGTRQARLHISKSRFGGEGATIGLKFDGRIGRFEEDPEGALTDEQREVLECIRAGAQSAEEVRKALKIRQDRALELVGVLVGRRLIARRPLRAL